MQKPGLTGFGGFFSSAIRAAVAAAAAAIASSCFTSATAFSKFLVASGTPTGAMIRFESVLESVIGFECQMNARPLPVGDCPAFASLTESLVQEMSGLISFLITGLQVK